MLQREVGGLEALEWLNDDKDDDQHHQNSRDLVEDAKETRGSTIFILGEDFHLSSKIAVKSRQSKDQREFHLQPGIPPISSDVRREEIQ